MDEKEVAVGPADVREDRVVVGPHDPERHEADQVSEIGRPELSERPEETCFRAGSRYLDFENEQRDRDGEDAVGKRLEAGGLGKSRFG